MACQLRMYTIKQGEMQGWLKLFSEKVVPMHRKYDIVVRGAWIDHQRSQFVWVREFVGSGTLEEQERRYVESEDRARVIGDEPKQFIEAMEVRVVEPVYQMSEAEPVLAANVAGVEQQT